MMLRKGNGMEVRITRVHADDRRLLGLARLHYRVGTVRCVAGVWVATCDGVVAGAMWVAYPVLNGSWRDTAWADAPRGKAPRAAWLNQNVRTIARVIVDPRLRGCGIATALVRDYLRTPLTARTEALAAMGHASPFFARAGMREVACCPSRRDHELRGAFARAGVEAHALCDVRASPGLLRGDVRRAVLAWARASKATARHADRASEDDALLVQLGVLAAGHMCGGVKVYVAGD